jgi:hypothetical protein
MVITRMLTDGVVHEHLFVGTAPANLHLLRIAMPFVIRYVAGGMPAYKLLPSLSARRLVVKSGATIRQQASGRVFTARRWSGRRGAGCGIWVSGNGGFPRRFRYHAHALCGNVVTFPWGRPRYSPQYQLPKFRCPPKVRFHHTGGREIKFNAIRALTMFKGKLDTTPTGATQGHVNASGVSLVYVTTINHRPLAVRQ